MNKLKENLICNVSYQLLILLVPMATAPYLSRVLGAEGIGVFSYVHSAAYFFFIFITLGLNHYGNRLIAKVGHDADARSRAFFSVYFMQLLCGIIVISAYGVYLVCFADPEYRRYFILYLPYVGSAAIDINWFFSGLGDFRWMTARSTAVKLLTLACIFAVVKGEADLSKYVLIMGLSHFAGNLALWTRLFRKVHACRPGMGEILRHLKPNLVLFLPVLAMSMYRVMDKIMIKQYSGILQNGYYENADKVIAMALTGFSAVAAVMTPFVSHMVAKGESEAVRRLFRDTMQISSCLSVGAVWGLLAVSKEFAPLFFGEGFVETGVLLQLLSCAVFLSGWKAVLRSQYIIPHERDKIYALSLAAGAAVNVILNAALIPVCQARGAAIGTLAAELTGFLIQTYAVSRDFRVSVLFRDAAAFLPAGLLMFALVKGLLRILPYSLLSVVFACCAGALAYGALVLASGFLFHPDRTKYLLRTYLPRTRRFQ